MMKLILDKRLKTGVLWQDKQHAELFKRVNAFASKIEDIAGGGETPKLLDFLDDYVVSHFHDEEMAMGETDYPEMLAHITQHTYFIEELALLKSKLSKEGITASDKEEVGTKVILWLKNHIAELDKKLGAFLLKKNAADRWRGYTLAVPTGFDDA